ncbi:hypothetical protein [uncultured Apibacter sp.]|uniref:tetratricopeptide repeat protein n=1 Tax=uncultured Apibacter sp. TaxID=1778616 RepID=UPI0025FFA824|nr:hypothetical protein [uncultured Apibacter sp.]
MKKIYLFISFLAIPVFIGMVKLFLFTDSNEENFTKGIKAFDTENYNAAIIYFNWVDKKKYPEVIHYLGDSYLKIGDVSNCIQLLQEVYDKKSVNNMNELSKLVNLLGIAYSKNNDLKQARFYFLEAKKLGNQNSLRNIQILDSLEQVQKNAPDINQ